VPPRADTASGTPASPTGQSSASHQFNTLNATLQYRQQQVFFMLSHTFSTAATTAASTTAVTAA
jgi:hypothetical protein